MLRFAKPKNQWIAPLKGILKFKIYIWSCGFLQNFVMLRENYIDIALIGKELIAKFFKSMRINRR